MTKEERELREAVAMDEFYRDLGRDYARLEQQIKTLKGKIERLGGLKSYGRERGTFFENGKESL